MASDNDARLREEMLKSKCTKAAVTFIPSPRTRVASGVTCAPEDMLLFPAAQPPSAFGSSSEFFKP